MHTGQLSLLVRPEVFSHICIASGKIVFFGLFLEINIDPQKEMIDGKLGKVSGVFRNFYPAVRHFDKGIQIVDKWRAKFRLNKKPKHSFYLEWKQRRLERLLFDNSEIAFQEEGLLSVFFRRCRIGADKV